MIGPTKLFDDSHSTKPPMMMVMMMMMMGVRTRVNQRDLLMECGIPSTGILEKPS
jgi:hypothetical protein